MADRNETVKRAIGNVYYRIEFGEVTVSNADTFTLDNFSSTDNLTDVYLTKKNAGGEMTCTHAALNVVTISGAGTNIQCYYIAYGVKA